MMFNKDGVKFIHQHTRPLAVDSMDAAAETIDAGILKAGSRSKPVDFNDPDERRAYARHLAWVIGFDALIDDRKAIHKVTSLLVD